MIDSNTIFFHLKNNFEKYNSIESKLMWGEDNDNVIPDVSIVIPTFKRGNLLKEAISSALNQKTKYIFEVIVVDNNSEYLSTLPIIQTYQSTKLKYYVNQSNIGMFGNMNRCFELAKADWVVVLHDDDFLDENFLNKMLHVVQKNSQIDYLAAKHKIWIDNDNNVVASKEKLIHRFQSGVYKVSPICFCSHFPVRAIGGLFRKKCVLQLGGFDEELYPSSDYSFMALFCLHFNIYGYNKSLYNYRMGQNESAKESVKFDFCIHDYYLQLALSEKLHIRNKIIGNIIKEKCRFAASFLSDKRSIDSINSLLGRKKWFYYILMRPIAMLITLWNLCKSIF